MAGSGIGLCIVVSRERISCLPVFEEELANGGFFPRESLFVAFLWIGSTVGGFQGRIV